MTDINRDGHENELWTESDDTRAAARSTSRGALLRRLGVAAGAAAATGGVVTVLPKLADSAPAAARDVRILNHVLRLEYLKAAFYEEAAQAELGGELQQLAQVLAGHERRHVTFLRKRLGGRAANAQTFDFGDATRDPDQFGQAARTLEEAAVSAYIGQGANLARRYMAAFAQITSVEARHAAWIADILERHPAPLAADEAKTPAQVRAAIDELGFEATT